MKSLIFAVALFPTVALAWSTREGDPGSLCRQMPKVVRVEFLQSPIYARGLKYNPEGYNESSFFFVVNWESGAAQNLFSSPVVPTHLAQKMTLRFYGQSGVADDGQRSLWCEYKIDEDTTGIIRVGLGRSSNEASLRGMTLEKIQDELKGIAVLSPGK